MNALASCFEAAQRYAARGWRIVPVHVPTANGCSCGESTCGSPGKHPTVKGWTERQFPPQAWANGEQRNIGIVTGAASGVVVVDVDAGGEETLAQLEREHGKLPPTVEARTGSGGRHLLFKHPGVTIRNDARKRLGPGLDVRGDGGFIVAAPSLHKSGQRYTWTPGKAPEERELAELPVWLLERLREPERAARPRPAPAPRASGPAGSREQAYVQAALDSACAAIRAADEGTRNSTLNTEAFSVFQLVGGGVLGRGVAEDALHAAALDAGLGEHEILATLRSAATAGEKEPRGIPPPSTPAIRSRVPGEDDGDGPPPPESENPPGPGARAARERANASGQHRNGEPDFDPFCGAKVPPFPIEVLPPTTARYVEAVAKHIQVPLDGPAIMVLATIAAVSAKRIRVRRLADGFEQPLNLYLMGLAESAERKSQIVAEVVQPLRDYEMRIAEEMHEQVTLAAEQRRVEEERAKWIRKRLASGKGTQELRAELDALAIELAKPPLRPLRLVTSAPTQGALEGLLADNGERMAIMGAEGGVFGIVAGRFSGNSKAPPDMDVLLQAWSGDAGDSDRKTATSTRLKAPALTIGLFVQPQVLTEVSSIYGAEEKGLTSRLLIAQIESKAHKQKYLGEPMDLDRRADWRKRVAELLEALPADHEERVITLPTDILRPAEAFFDEVTAQMAPGGPLALPALRAFGSKLRGQVERLIGILHVAQHGPDAPDIACTEATVGLAVKLARYFLEHGKAARSATAADPTIDRARRLIEHCLYNGIDSFKRREAQMHRWGGCRKPEDLDAALVELAQRGYLIRKGATFHLTAAAKAHGATK